MFLLTSSHTLLDTFLTFISLFQCRRSDASAVILSVYAGSGVNGTNVMFVPDAAMASDQPGGSPMLPPQSTYTQQSLGSTTDSGSGSSGVNSSWKIITGFTLGLGGALLLASAALFIRQRQRRHREGLAMHYPSSGYDAKSPFDGKSSSDHAELGISMEPSQLLERVTMQT